MINTNKTAWLPKFNKLANENPARLALALTIVGASLRLLGLGARPLWFDEAISTVYAQQDVATLLQLNAGDNHPPGYYLGLKFWLTIFGSGETALRLFSVLPGVAAIWLVWLIGRRLFAPNAKIGLFATAFMALSPFQIYFSQEVRNYAIMEFAVLLAVWFWLRALEKNRWAAWLGLTLAGTLGLVCNFTTAFYLLALGLYLVFNFRTNWQNGLLLRLFSAGAATGLLSAIFLWPKLSGRLETIKGNFWIPAPDLLVILRTFYTFVFGAIQVERFVIAFLLAFVLLIIVLAQVLPYLWAFFKTGNSSPSADASNPPTADPNLQSVLRTSWLLFGPILLVAIVSWFFQPLYLDKALLACAPFYYLLIGWAIFRTDRKRRGGWILAGVPAVCGLLLALAGLPDLYSGTINPLYIARYDAPRINAYLQAQSRPDDIVLTATDISWLPLVYYNRSPAPPRYAIKEYPYPNIFPDLIKTLGSEWYSQERALQHQGRLWVVFELNAPESSLQAAPRPAETGGEINWLHSPDWQKSRLAWFDTNFSRVKAETLDRVMLVLYERKK